MMSNWQYVTNGLDNGLAPRWQAIIWTNNDLVYADASLGLDELLSYAYNYSF